MIRVAVRGCTLSTRCALLVVVFVLAVTSDAFLSAKPNRLTGRVAFYPFPMPSLARREIFQTYSKLSLYSTRGSGEDGEVSADEVKKMEKLIVSLSLEPTDKIRRKRLASIFEEELAKPNGAPQKFADLFDVTLIKIGDQVQTAAREAALENQGDVGEKKEKSDQEREDGERDWMASSSHEERQLWAMIDMMVQSKTIVKKAFGSLGSEGVFS